MQQHSTSLLLSPCTNEALAIQRAAGNCTRRNVPYAGDMPATVPVRMRGKKEARGTTVVPVGSLDLVWWCAPAHALLHTSTNGMCGCGDAWPVWFKDGSIALGGMYGEDDGGRQQCTHAFLHTRQLSLSALHGVSGERRRGAALCGVHLKRPLILQEPAARQAKPWADVLYLALHRALDGQECMQHFTHAARTHSLLGCPKYDCTALYCL
ncbi:hypothetical protein CERZMDRAFT_83807 [Cercospora zeae-maydis SCOH1-5]|uniref:Uncharacterized protein n=1 Tax=Cercospora zeae-maydis SCOH1-5 TaxID=717836 RepID=A0A6A6FJS1_9PEZI|nr:hypothetical protein CERZMDRAFT_83807 [Cercospora zeae-maydis SCOH1-5]